MSLSVASNFFVFVQIKQIPTTFWFILRRSHFSHWSLSYYGGARGVMVIVAGCGHDDMSSNPGQADCISHSTNTLGKGMNPNILPPAMGK